MATYYGEDIFFLMSALTSSIPSLLLSIAAYVLTAIALYTMAKSRGLSKAWMAWVPVLDSWILGSLSDQYQYLVKGQNKNKRKVLLILNVVMLVMFLLIMILVAVMATGAIFAASEAGAMSSIMGPAMGILGLCLPLFGVSIAILVIRYMALYDIYRSVDPSNSVLFLVLSIIFNVTEPFFLFFNRHKELGMPPRKRQEPVYIPEEPIEEKDYL